MKKILFALAMILSVTAASAQTKTPAAAKSALDKAIATSQNAKKATKAATWLNLGKAYLDAYNAPTGVILSGIDKNQLMLMGFNERPVSSEMEPVTIGGETIFREAYADKNVYYYQNGTVAFTEVTKPVVENALEKAIEAYTKAKELDVKGSSAKKIESAIEDIHTKAIDEAYVHYNFGRMEQAGALFSLASDAYATVGKPDFENQYNSAYTYKAVGKLEKAAEILNKCLENDYYHDGDVFSQLGDIYKTIDSTKVIPVLKKGFEKFPQNQGILVGLINSYIETKADVNEIISLIDKAIVLEPNNASLYYVKGNIYKELDNEEQVLASYGKCFEVDPSYVFGFVGEGQYYYDKALKILEDAQDADWRTYDKEFAKYKEVMKKSIEPFENAFNITTDEGVKLGVAEYLKNIYFRYTNDGDEYVEAYNKYDEFVKANSK